MYNVVSTFSVFEMWKEILVKKGMNPDDYMLHSEDEKEMILYNRNEKRLEAVEK